MTKIRLDQRLLQLGAAPTRSQAENLIRLGMVEVDGRVINKTGHFVSPDNQIKVNQTDNYVSRAGLKLSSANRKFKIDFVDKVVLDVGSSTGGFSDYALQNGAKKVVAVDVGTDQLHPSLRNNPKIELHEKTDIRDVRLKIRELRSEKNSENPKSPILNLQSVPDIVLVDVSFISLRDILPHIYELMTHDSLLIAMVKPQFEADMGQVNRGIIKNERMRRQILKNFENWVKSLFKVVDKVDSGVYGAKGNLERFYSLIISK